MHVRGREHGYNLKGNKGGKGLRAEWPMSPLTAPVFCVCTGAVAPPVPVEGITGGGRLRRLPLHGCRSAVQVRWAPGGVAVWSYLVSPDQVGNHPLHRCITASIMVTEQGSLSLTTTTIACMSTTAVAAASDNRVHPVWNCPLLQCQRHGIPPPYPHLHERNSSSVRLNDRGAGPVRIVLPRGEHPIYGDQEVRRSAVTRRRWFIW